MLVVKKQSSRILRCKDTENRLIDKREAKKFIE